MKRAFYAMVGWMAWKFGKRTVRKLRFGSPRRLRHFDHRVDIGQLRAEHPRCADHVSVSDEERRADRDVAHSERLEDDVDFFFCVVLRSVSVLLAIIDTLFTPRYDKSASPQIRLVVVPRGSSTLTAVPSPPTKTVTAGRRVRSPCLAAQRATSCQSGSAERIHPRAPLSATNCFASGRTCSRRAWRSDRPGTFRKALREHHQRRYDRDRLRLLADRRQHPGLVKTLTRFLAFIHYDIVGSVAVPEPSCLRWLASSSLT